MVSEPCVLGRPEQQLKVVRGQITYLTHPQFCAGPGREIRPGSLALEMAPCSAGTALSHVESLCFDTSDPSRWGAPVVMHWCRGAAAPVPRATAPKVLGGDLFCWMAVLPGSFEEQLRRAAEERQASIYACDSHKVYAAEKSPTITYDDNGYTGWNNGGGFKRVWKQLIAEEEWLKFSWTVKVDPDTVWVPARLRPKLAHWAVKRTDVVYVKNHDDDFGFMGPLEIISPAAVRTVGLLIDRCIERVGEDLWLKNCLERAGSLCYTDVGLLYQDNEVDTCWDHSFVAYHAFKDLDQYNLCLDRAT